MHADEKQAFAERLKLALRRSPRSVDTPTELALQFNLRHPNDPVTPQAAMKWLAGKAKPTPDKITTLAAWLDVSEHWLSYGAPDLRTSRSRAIDTTQTEEAAAAVSADELILLMRYRRLSGHRQHIINELIAELAMEQEVWPDNP